MSVQLEEVKQKARKVLRRSLWIGLALLLVSGTVYYFWRTFTRSEGSRTGTLVQVSRTGYVFKTYEGQLHLAGSMQISEQSTWYFSIQNEGVFKSLQSLEGQMVQCHYRRLVDPFPWQGKTEYIVYKAEPAQQPAAPRVQ